MLCKTAAATVPSGRGEYADPQRCAELFRGEYRELPSIDADDQVDLKAAGALFEPPPVGSLARTVTKNKDQTEAEWQTHRALFRNVDRDRSVLVWVNAEEHLRLAVEFKGCDVREAFHAYAS
eukprot:1777033-Prymnesium_polylepis.1